MPFVTLPSKSSGSPEGAAVVEEMHRPCVPIFSCRSHGTSKPDKDIKDRLRRGGDAPKCVQSRVSQCQAALPRQGISQLRFHHGEGQAEVVFAMHRQCSAAVHWWAGNTDRPRLQSSFADETVTDGEPPTKPRPSPICHVHVGSV